MTNELKPCPECGADYFPQASISPAYAWFLVHKEGCSLAPKATRPPETPATAAMQERIDALRDGFIAARMKIKLYRDLNGAPYGDPELNDIMETVEAALAAQGERL